MKYIAYNISTSQVKLELYIDSTTNGEGTGGGDWKKVGEVVDGGSWPAAPSAITGCTYSDQNTVITQGHGALLMRTDNDEAEYKKVSVREIDPMVPSRIAQPTPRNSQRLLGMRLLQRFDLLGRVH